MRRLPLIALGCFALGVLLMIPFEYWFTLALGVIALFAAVVTGVFAIATPEFLDEGPEFADVDD